MPFSKAGPEAGSALRAAGELHNSAHVHAIRYGDRGTSGYKRAYSQHVGRFLSCMREFQRGKMAKRRQGNMAASLTSKQLTAIEKSMVAVVDDEGKQADIKALFDDFRKALGEGTPVTEPEVTQAIEVAIAKASDPDPVELPDDPMAPIFDGLYRQIAPFAKKAGVSETTLQALFQKAYGSSLETLDEVIVGTTETVAKELGADLSKARKPKPDEDEEDEDCDDMEKILKAAGVPATIIKMVGGLQAEVAALTHDKAMGLFTKRAAEIGEPGMAADLLKLHEVDPELCARVEKTLKAKNEVLRKGKAWAGEIGSSDSAPAEGSQGALDQLEGHARELMKSRKNANGKPVSFQKAFSLACDEHPDLYAEYNGAKHREIARGGV